MLTRVFVRQLSFL